MTEPKTVTVRIAVAIDPYGCWCAAGHSGMDDDIKVDHARDGVEVGEAVYWITATLPLEIAGTVEAAGDA